MCLLVGETAQRADTCARSMAWVHSRTGHPHASPGIDQNAPLSNDRRRAGHVSMGRHVRPMRLDVLKTRRARLGAEYLGPAVWHVVGVRPPKKAGQPHWRNTRVLSIVVFKRVVMARLSLPAMLYQDIGYKWHRNW